MESGTHATRLSRSASVQSLKVSMTVEEMEKALESLPKWRDIRKKSFTKEEDDLILKYWNSGRRKSDIPKIMGICETLIRRRYRELTEGEHGNID